MYPQESLQALMGKQNLQLILQSAIQSHDMAKSKVSLHFTGHTIHALACCLRFVCFYKFWYTGTVGKLEDWIMAKVLSL